MDLLPGRCSGLRRRGAFTLIEVLVVVAIIALLMAVILPSLRKSRQQARRTLCLNNLHQISVALYSYQVDYRGKPPEWKLYNEQIADGLALWVQGVQGEGHPTRLGMLYPRYIGKDEDVFFCPDASLNELLNKEGSIYPWSNFGTDLGWAYCSYDYRPRYYFGPNGEIEWLGADYSKPRSGNLSIVSDAFSGWWEVYGPYPTHSPVQSGPPTLYYNVAYMDGGARVVKDPSRPSELDPSAKEYRTRAAAPAQEVPEYVTPSGKGGFVGRVLRLPSRYTYLKPGPRYDHNPLLPSDRIRRNEILSTTDHIDRGWMYFDYQ